MFLSHSLLALPVLLLPLYGAACALPNPAQGTETTVESSAVKTFASLRDVARPLLIFAPSEDTAEFQQQLSALGLIGGNHAASEKELADRNVVIIPILNRAPRSSPQRAITVTLAADDATKARRRLAVGSTEFRVVLIGKDGGEKKTSATPISLQDLLDSIDAMPMRQREMRQKPSGR